MSMQLFTEALWAIISKVSLLNFLLNELTSWVTILFQTITMKKLESLSIYIRVHNLTINCKMQRFQDT